MISNPWNTRKLPTAQEYLEIHKMTGKKRRVKTGCLTCRQRRVKWDEGKPTCQRCKAANVYCEGYDSQRHLEARSRSLTIDSSQVSSSHAFNILSLSSFISYISSGWPAHCGLPCQPRLCGTSATSTSPWRVDPSPIYFQDRACIV